MNHVSLYPSTCRHISAAGPAEGVNRTVGPASGAQWRCVLPVKGGGIGIGRLVTISDSEHRSPRTSVKLEKLHHIAECEVHLTSIPGIRFEIMCA
jgi:hypothetical protein